MEEDQSLCVCVCVRACARARVCLCVCVGGWVWVCVMNRVLNPGSACDLALSLSPLSVVQYPLTRRWIQRPRARLYAHSTQPRFIHTHHHCNTHTPITTSDTQGPYAVKLFKTGTMELTGAMRDEKLATSVALKVAECCKRSGDPIEIIGDFTTSVVKAQCNVGRSVILPKLAKQDGASPVSGAGTAQYVELNMGDSGAWCLGCSLLSV
jgi:hypothetical protein